MTLKPVGTEYWHDYGIDMTSADSRGTRILYKVVEHVMCDRFTGDKVGALCERIEPIKVEKYSTQKVSDG